MSLDVFFAGFTVKEKPPVAISAAAIPAYPSDMPATTAVARCRSCGPLPSWLITPPALHGYEPGGVVHPGDPFGTVLAWLWETSPDEVGLFVADYMVQIRDHDELAGEPDVRFEDLLRSLHLALLNGFAGGAPQRAPPSESRWFGSQVASGFG